MKILTEDIEQIKQKIADYITELSESQAFDLWNSYCDASDLTDEYIMWFDEDEIEDMFDSHWDAMRAAVFGDIDFADRCFSINGYGNIVTGNVDNFADWEDVVNYIIAEDEDFGFEGIREILNEL